MSSYIGVPQRCAGSFNSDEETLTKAVIFTAALEVLIVALEHLAYTQSYLNLCMKHFQFMACHNVCLRMFPEYLVLHLLLMLFWQWIRVMTRVRRTTFIKFMNLWCVECLPNVWSSFHDVQVAFLCFMLRRTLKVTL